MEYEKELIVLKAYFADAQLPVTPVRLNGLLRITNVRDFVNECFRMIDSGRPSSRKLGIRDLQRLKSYIEADKHHTS